MAIPAGPALVDLPPFRGVPAQSEWGCPGLAGPSCLGRDGGQEGPTDPAPLVVGRDEEPVDVAIRLQVRESDGPLARLDHHRESPAEPPGPPTRVDVPRGPRADLLGGVMPGV